MWFSRAGLVGAYVVAFGVGALIAGTTVSGSSPMPSPVGQYSRAATKASQPETPVLASADLAAQARLLTTYAAVRAQAERSTGGTDYLAFDIGALRTDVPSLRFAMGRTDDNDTVGILAEPGLAITLVTRSQNNRCYVLRESRDTLRYATDPQTGPGCKIADRKFDWSNDPRVGWKTASS